MANFEDIGRLLNDLQESFENQKFLNRLGLAGIRIIKDRTRKGIDVDGQNFKDYSDSYKKTKRKEGLPIHPVNLTFNDIDGMMTSIDHFVATDLNSVEIGFKDSLKEELMSFHSVSGAGKSRVIRKAWGFSDDEFLSLGEIAQEHLELRLKQLTNKYQ